MFWAAVLENHGHNCNQRSRICLIANFGVKNKNP